MNLNSSLQDFTKEVQERINAFMARKLETYDDHALDLKEAMGYALLLGGKRSRPFLVYATGLALGVKEELLDYPAAVIECIHAYSLVHDDMPEMDNDKLHRGKPTVHCKFGQATALLAGDALQSLAYEFLTTAHKGLDPQVSLKQVAILSTNAGLSGMCGGQAMDLHFEKQQISLDTLKILHRKKTGALIKAAVMMGAYAKKDLEEKEAQILEQYATYVGLAFQIWDDVLDVIGDTKILGKSAGADIALGKSTYPALLGLEESKKQAYEACDGALKSLSLLDGNFKLLADFARFTVSRDH